MNYSQKPIKQSQQINGYRTNEIIAYAFNVRNFKIQIEEINPQKNTPNSRISGCVRRMRSKEKKKKKFVWIQSYKNHKHEKEASKKIRIK